MALARSTISLFGFLATTALGVTLSFLVKSKNYKIIGMGLAAFGVLGLFGWGVIKLINHLCCKKQQSLETTHFIDDGIDPAAPETLTPGEDDDFSSPDLLTEAKLLNPDRDNLSAESSYNSSQFANIGYIPQIIGRMLSSLQRRKPSASIQHAGHDR